MTPNKKRKIRFVQKKEPNNLENNKKIVALSDEAKVFQKELIGYGGR